MGDAVIEQDSSKVSVVARTLDHPFGMVFLPVPKRRLIRSVIF